MAIYPGAIVKIVAKHKKPLIATQTIWHTAVSGADSLFGYFNRDDTTVCSHFYIRGDGVVEQYVDTKFQAPANLHANKTAISVETWDDGKPNTTPWTARQLAALAALTLWVHQVHGVPLKRCASPTSPGVGYHSMWGAPSAWTPSAGKTCPGPVRIKQVDTVILAALGRRVLSTTATITGLITGDDELTPEQAKQLADVHIQLTTKWQQLGGRTLVDALGVVLTETRGEFDFGGGLPKTTLIGAIGRLTRKLGA